MGMDEGMYLYYGDRWIGDPLMKYIFISKSRLFTMICEEHMRLANSQHIEFSSLGLGEFHAPLSLVEPQEGYNAELISFDSARTIVLISHALPRPGLFGRSSNGSTLAGAIPQNESNGRDPIQPRWPI
jgi:hypothetical protein